MRLARLASHLYPRWWRERYGDEFAALLEDSRPGAAGALDIVKGALWMRLTNPGQVFALYAAIGIAISAIAWLTQPPPPAAHALLKMPAGDTPEQAVERLAIAAQPILSRTSLTTTIRNLDLYNEKQHTMPLEDVIEEMKDDIKIEAVKNGLVRVEARGERPHEVADYLAQRFSKAGYQMYEAATPPPAQSTVPRTILQIGAPAGLLFGLAAAWWTRRRKKESAS